LTPEPVPFAVLTTDPAMLIPRRLCALWLVTKGRKNFGSPPELTEKEQSKFSRTAGEKEFGVKFGT